MRKFPIFALLLVACGGSGSETPPPAEPISMPQTAGGELQTVRRSEVDPTYESTPELPARAPVPTGNPSSKRGGRGRR